MQGVVGFLTTTKKSFGEKFGKLVKISRFDRNVATSFVASLFWPSLYIIARVVKIHDVF